MSSNGAFVFQYPAGLEEGASVGFWWSWDTPGETSGNEYRAIYDSGWLKLPGQEFEGLAAAPNQSGGFKMLGYWGVAAGQDQVASQLYSYTRTSNGQRTGDAFVLDIRQQGAVAGADPRADRSMPPNVGPGVIRVGQWVRYEVQFVLNVKSHEYRDVLFRTTAYPRGSWAASGTPSEVDARPD